MKCCICEPRSSWFAGKPASQTQKVCDFEHPVQLRQGVESLPQPGQPLEQLNEERPCAFSLVANPGHGLGGERRDVALDPLIILEVRTIRRYEERVEVQDLQP